MCGRYGYDLSSIDVVKERFEIGEKVPLFGSFYNAAPSQNHPIVTRHSPNKLQLAFWGLIPRFAKDLKFGYKTINARVETVDTSGIYKHSLATERCLVIAGWFYEWDRKTTPRQPYLFRLKSNELFAFAGLYNDWKNPETGEVIRSFTIITTEANSVVSPVHDRMPVILPKELEDDWLNPDIVEVEQVLKLIQPRPASEMEAFKVGLAVGNTRNNSPELINSL
jgi:putative SOS response-associated peptidase YedK